MSQPLMDGPAVAILLCTFNGQAFLDEQLQSIASQQHRNWMLVASDDGSDDATVSILERFASEVPQRVVIRSGPRTGVVRNFLDLATDPSIDSEFFAFADQDDVWTPDHLRRALDSLQSGPAATPALHCGRTRLISADGQAIGLSPLFSRRPSFRNAIVQSLAGGNTMVFNRAARLLLDKNVEPCPASHDWWIYQLVSGAGGRVVYDATPTVLYRQHDANLIGSNVGAGPRLKRLRMLLSGRFAEWTTRNLSALEKFEHLMTPENREVLRLCQGMRQGSVRHRMACYLRARVYRQTLLGNLGLALAVMMKRV